MKKIIYLLLLIIFLTGCDVKYDLVITDKEKIKETIYVYIDNKIINNNSMTIDEYLDYYSNLYLQQSGYKDLKIDTKKGDDISYFIAKRNYKSLDDYISSYTFKNMFNSANIERVGKYVSFTTSKNAYLENIKNDELISEQSKYKSFTVSIKFYNKLVGHNADEVDEKNNIYTWNVNETSNKDYIYFKFGPELRYDVIIKDYIINNLTSLIIIGILILIIIVISLKLALKIKKNNEI